MPEVNGKKYPYTKAGKAAAKKAAKKSGKSMLTAKQKTLPKELQQKIVKAKKRKAADGNYSRGY